MVFNDFCTILNHFLTKSRENCSNSMKTDADWCGSIPGSKINIFYGRKLQKNGAKNQNEPKNPLTLIP